MGLFRDKESAAQGIEIDIDDLIPDPNQPRKVFDEAGIKVLSSTVKHHGQISPILVRPKDANGKYMIIDGERRWRAALANQKTKVLAQIREIEDDESLIIQLFANIGGGVREGLNVRERAEALKRVVEKHGSQEKAAEALGLTQPWISANIAVLNIPANIEELRTANVVKDNKVLVQLAKLQDLDKPAADALIEKAKESGKMPREAVHDALAAAGGLRKRAAKTETEAGEASKPEAAASPAGVSGAPSASASAAPQEPRRVNRAKVKKVATELGVSEDIDHDELLDRLMDAYLQLKSQVEVAHAE